MAVLDRLLETTMVLHEGPELVAIPSPLERLLALLRQEMERLTREPHRLRVFFEFWMAGIKQHEIRVKMRREAVAFFCRGFFFCWQLAGRCFAPARKI